MRNIFFLFLTSLLYSQSLSAIDLNQILSNPQAQQALQNYQGQNSEFSQFSTTNANNNNTLNNFATTSDSISLLLSNDSALAKPYLLKKIDSLYKYSDSLKQDTLPDRYSQQLFRGEKESLFSSTTSRVGKDYPLKAGDKLVLSIWGDFEKEYTLPVQNQGTVFIEGIGRVSVNGSTLEEAEDKVKARLSKIYSGIKQKTTQMALRLEELSPIKVFLLGEVTNPGSYVFHGNTSILLALYIAQGPNAIGSVRNIQVTRDNETFTVDLYDYLFKSKLPENSILKDGDIVYLPRGKSLVKISGDVGRPATYELKDEEGLKELLQYSGLLNPTAAPMAATVTRILPDGKQQVLNLGESRSYLTAAQFQLQDGDKVLFPTSTETEIRSVSVLGAVKYPGSYEIQDSLKIKDLIAEAGGPQEGAFTERVQILRTKKNGTYELFAHSLNSDTDFYVKNQDTLYVYSANNMIRKDSVFVSGAVKKPKGYTYYEGMTVKDLILLSGGFTPDRETGKVRLERVIPGQRDVEVLFLTIDNDYKAHEGKIILRPFDRIAIPQDPHYYRQEVVKLEGAFLRPGNYSLLQSDETLKSIIQRAGGFKSTAYLEGAQFFRSVKKSIVQNLDSLEAGKEPPKSDLDSVFGEHTQYSETQDSLYLIGVDLKSALENNDLNNVPLQDGDSIYIPTKLISVRVFGEVGAPGHVLFKTGEDVEYYVSRAGGFTITADSERVIMIYANGERTTLDNIYREPDAGSEIFIPAKVAEAPTDWLRIFSTTASIFSSLVATIVVISSVN